MVDAWGAGRRPVGDRGGGDAPAEVVPLERASEALGPRPDRAKARKIVLELVN
jgi:hypothetical protein